MIVYRLAHEKHAILQASGIANRWNGVEQYVLYASGSVSLCALELLAHTCGIRPSGVYKIMHIEIKGTDNIFELTTDKLPNNWHLLSAYHLTQEIGSDWYEAKDKLLLKIPSAIVPSESNYAINTKHPDFGECVSILELQNFFWDDRFPSS